MPVIVIVNIDIYLLCVTQWCLKFFSFDMRLYYINSGARLLYIRSSEKGYKICLKIWLPLTVFLCSEWIKYNQLKTTNLPIINLYANLIRFSGTIKPTSIKLIAQDWIHMMAHLCISMNSKTVFFKWLLTT